MSGNRDGRYSLIKYLFLASQPLEELVSEISKHNDKSELNFHEDLLTN